jgi:glycosyltransferase involved in cell wall biosynthesis
MRNPQSKIHNRKYPYVAYPMSLMLKAANAIQTYHTAWELRARLAARGDTLQVIVPRWLRDPSRFADPGVAARHLPRIPFNKFTRFWKSSGWSYLERSAFSAELIALLTWQRLTGRKSAAIYVRDIICAYWLTRLRVLHGAPVVYEVHDLEATNPSRAQGPLWSRWIAALDRTVLRGPAALVSLTAAFRAYLAEHGLRRPAEVAVIPDAFDPAVYRPLDPAECRARLGLPADAFIVCYAGLTFAYRRLDLLLAAFRGLGVGAGGLGTRDQEAGIRDQELVASHAQPALRTPPSAIPDPRPLTPDPLLVLVGGRPFEVAELRAEARRLGLAEDAVRFVGQRGPEEVVPYLNAADVLTIPDTVTTITASPLKLFEYMAVGRPILLRELPALREILDDESAVFVPPGDPAAFTAALAALRADPAWRARLGAAAWARSAQYTYAARAAQVLAVLARVGGCA